MAPHRRIVCLVLALLMAWPAAVVADVLTLRDGRRVVGTLVTVRGGTIEFEHAEGRDAGRVRRYDRRDVRSIQFDDEWSDSWRGDDTRGRGALRERGVNVSGRTAWTDTGLDVRSGQDVMFSATGQVRWGPNRRHGAAGERNSPYNAARPMPDRSAAALIGKIGENGDPFFIGDDRNMLRMRGTGRLFLGINDDYLADNSGSLRVVVSY
jgi:hypothetical protein